MPLHYNAFLKAFEEMGLGIELTEKVYYGFAGAPLHELTQYLNQH